MIALLAALLFGVAAIAAEQADGELWLTALTWACLGLVLLALHLGGMAWLAARSNQRG